LSLQDILSRSGFDVTQRESAESWTPAYPGLCKRNVDFAVGKQD
jgi:hypothetical protein